MTYYTLLKRSLKMLFSDKNFGKVDEVFYHPKSQKKSKSVKTNVIYE